MAPDSIAADRAWQADIDAPFDEVWDDLIDLVSATSFAIQHVERASGLVTLDFSARGRTIDEYLDCGAVVRRGRDHGPSLLQYLSRRGHPAALAGTLNIFVRVLDERRTSVRMTARYVVSAGVKFSAVFNTGGGAYLQRNRWCQPTHRVESSILDAIEDGNLRRAEEG